MDPADMSGGTGGGGYPDWTKSQLMLLLLRNKLQEAYDDGESQLMIEVVRGGGGSRVRVGYPESVDVSDEILELGRGGEAVSVFDRLWREDYIHLDFGSQSPSDDMSTPTLYSLSSKGLTDIGKLPDPDIRIAAAFAAARQAIKQKPGIPDPEKRDMLDTLEKTASLANNVGGIARAFFEGLSQPGGGYFG